MSTYSVPRTVLHLTLKLIWELLRAWAPQFDILKKGAGQPYIFQWEVEETECRFQTFHSLSLDMCFLMQNSTNESQLKALHLGYIHFVEDRDVEWKQTDEGFTSTIHYSNKQFIALTDHNMLI